MTTNTPLQVSQAAREAAADLQSVTFGFREKADRGFRGGGFDAHPLVQAFARFEHSLREREPAPSRERGVPVDYTVVAAAAIMDRMMGGDKSWRERVDFTDAVGCNFLQSADWATALEYANAALLAATPQEPALETRPETREFDPDSPNGKLMIAVCAALSIPQSEAGERLAKALVEATRYPSGQARLTHANALTMVKAAMWDCASALSPIPQSEAGERNHRRAHLDELRSRMTPGLTTTVYGEPSAPTAQPGGSGLAEELRAVIEPGVAPRLTISRDLCVRILTALRTQEASQDRGI